MRGWVLGLAMIAAAPAAAQDFALRGRLDPSPVSAVASAEALGQVVFAPTPGRPAGHGPFAVSKGRYDLDFTPHARANAVGGVDAGAEVRVSRDLGDKVVDRLGDLGVRDGASFGDRGRFYLFAAASGRAVGMNMLRGEGGWSREGWSTDPTSALVGDAQAGLGWRKGPMQASVGYIHREMKATHMLRGVEGKDDSLVALSLTIKPGP